MGTRNEYASTLIFSKDQLYQARRAQAEIRQKGFDQKNQTNLIQGLSTFASVLSLMFKLPTPVTLAAGVISLALGSSQSEVNVLISLSIAGEDYLDEVYDFMYDNPDYDLIEVTLPFLEFVEEGFRIVTGIGIVTKVHSSSGHGWIIM